LLSEIHGPHRSSSEQAWLQTTPGAQWFAYFRVSGPGARAFDGSWKPSNFEPAKATMPSLPHASIGLTTEPAERRLREKR
jgi:hypothetical protein